MAVLQPPATGRRFLPCKSLLLLKKGILHPGSPAPPAPLTRVTVSRHPSALTTHTAMAPALENHLKTGEGEGGHSLPCAFPSTPLDTVPDGSARRCAELEGEHSHLRTQPR